tara:strand:+ start:625 stop:1431 length:807 start_codon:yes stop_codon:yes gene_type:complete
MIVVNYLGQLGNNMFQYAFGRILADKTGYKMFCQPIPGFPVTQDTPPGSMCMFPEIVVEGQIVDIPSLTTERKLNQKIILNGFFQRYEYYKEYKDQIREWYKMEPRDIGQTDDDIIIHIRLGDNVYTFDPETPYIMPFEYYEKALENTSFNKLYICTDTPEHDIIKKFAKYNPILTAQDTLGDFRILKSFNKIVMSQSTFSWWAAFLSDASEIYTPVPQPGNSKLINEWSIGSPEHALFVDDEERYKYIKQYDGNEWKMVQLQDIEER